MKTKKTATKNITFFKIESARKSRRETARLCRCGTPEVWCLGIECFPDFELDAEEARAQAERAAAFNAGRDFDC